MANPRSVIRAGGLELALVAEVATTGRCRAWTIAGANRRTMEPNFQRHQVLAGNFFALACVVYGWSSRRQLLDSGTTDCDVQTNASLSRYGRETVDSTCLGAGVLPITQREVIFSRSPFWRAGQASHDRRLPGRIPTRPQGKGLREKLFESHEYHWFYPLTDFWETDIFGFLLTACSGSQGVKVIFTRGRSPGTPFARTFSWRIVSLLIGRLDRDASNVLLGF